VIQNLEWKLDNQEISYLDTVLREVQSCEQTQELRLTDGMPDVGRIVAAWGQTILRGKEWRGDSIACNGGMMVWVLYAPEDGSTERCLETWIPFQMRWDLPENTPEGEIRMMCLPRFVDARNVSPRKIILRAGMAALAEAVTSDTALLSQAHDLPEDIQLRRSSYPMRLNREAGEKTFLLDEELTVPDSVPHPQKLICFRLEPRLSDRKVLANKIVFRGSAGLHVLYRSDEGQLHSWDFPISFSQYADLNGEHSTDAQADICLMPTNLELELDEEGHFRLKAGITAQYLISDKQLVEVTEDAYSPVRELELGMEMTELPVILESRREALYPEQMIPVQADIAVDTAFLPDFPRQRRQENLTQLESTGQFQTLYYGEDGALRSAAARWEGQQRLPADENSIIQAVPLPPEVQSTVGSGQLLAKAELPMEWSTVTRQQLPMVSRITAGEVRTPDPTRPSLILRRAGEDSLWDIAKRAGSTVEEIRKVNQLSDEPIPGQMLLIPVRA